MTEQRRHRIHAVRGFTLAEMVIALGILAVGLTMVTSLFPAAIHFRQRSVNDSLGTLICQNGLTLSKLAFTASDIPSTILAVKADEVNTTPLSIADQRYPCGSATSTTTGFVVMARKINDDSDLATDEGCQFVIVSYRKNVGETVRIRSVDISTPLGQVTDTLTISSANVGDLRLGSPLIWRRTGEFARIVAIDDTGTQVTLDHSITVPTLNKAFVIVESGTSKGSRSCARTGLGTRPAKSAEQGEHDTYISRPQVNCSSPFGLASIDSRHREPTASRYSSTAGALPIR